MSINGGGVGYDSANQSLSNLNDAGNARFTSKQDTLVSGTNIKTVNGVDLLGSGNVVIGEGGTIAIDQTYNSVSTNAQSGTAVAESLLTVANKDLSNLSSNGQMVIDSQNGTISNCILEIPQNLNLTLSNNVLTLKSGSIITLTGSIYTTYTTTVDRTYTISNSQAQGRYYIFASVNGGVIQAPISINKVSSGNTASQPTWDVSLANSAYYNTDTKTLQYATGSQWIDWGVAYPLCMVDVDSNGVASFTKFSDGRDCIFNGMGFIGQTKYILPNVKVLQSIGKNVDGTLKSREYITDSLQLVTQGGTINRRMFLNYNTLQITVSEWYYDEETNLWYEANGNPFVTGVSFLGNCFTTNGIVTDFTINQPYEGVRNLLTDDIKEEVAIKQVDVTTLTGYDATATQVLKNINGVLTWVTEE